MTRKNQKPRRIYHEVFALDDKEDVIMCSSIDLLNEFALSCCNYWFYEMGFQVVYAIHKPKNKRLHIHFAINTTSYLDGKKRHEKREEIIERQALFIMWFAAFIRKAQLRELEQSSYNERNDQQVF